MDMETLAKEVREQRALLEQTFISVEKTRKYFLWTLVATVIAFILPLLAAAFIIPSFLSAYSELLGGGSLGL
ncbi:MAG: hypothetical protein WCT02_00560 [Candidatus Paceibacterota bacterium]